MKSTQIMNRLARAAVLLLLAVLTSATTWADNNVNNYFDPTAAPGDQSKTAPTPTAITDNTTSLGTANTETWYYVSGTFTNSNRIVVSGTVNIILVDGCSFTASKGIRLPKGNTLNIYAQKAGAGCGKLTADHDGSDAAIGGNGGENSSSVSVDGGDGEDAGTVNIYGGKITVKGGIGGGNGGSGYSDWDSDEESDGGDGGDGGTISFYGGQVYVSYSVGGGEGGWGDDWGNDGDADITLSWTSATDEFYAYSFYVIGKITLVKAFMDKDDESERFEAGNIYAYGLEDITLVPAETIYDITLGGSYDPACLKASKEKARGGTLITLTAVNGYSVSSITVTDANNQAVSLTDNHDGTWTFTMPASNVTVGAVATRYHTISAPARFTVTAADNDRLSQGDKLYYKPGAEMTISIDLSDGYEMANFSITNGSNNTPVDYTQNGTVWTFSMPAADVTVNGDVVYPAQYIAADGTTKTAYAIVIDGETGDLSVGWYLAKGNVTISDRREIDGTVNLILADGCALSYEKGICLYDRNTLNIFAQSTGEGSGKLMASHVYNDAAIGGNGGSDSWFEAGSGEDAGTLNIYGGQIIVDGNIGGGDGGEGCYDDEDWNSTGWGGDGGNGGIISVFGGIVHVSGTIGGGNGGPGGLSNGNAGSGTVNLNWTNTTDEIYAKGYNATVTFAKAFTDGLGTNFAVGECSNNSTINDKTLYPEGTTLYTVTLPADDPASLKVSPAAAKAGTTITLTAVNGYSVSNVTVTDANNQAVNVTDNQDGTWTFTIPASNVTVSAATTRCYTISAPDFLAITTANQGDRFVQQGTTYYKPQTTVTITVNEDYTCVDGFDITDSNSNGVSYEGTCPWTFTMPAADVTIFGNGALDTNSLLLLEGTEDFGVTDGTRYNASNSEGCEKLLDGKYDEYDEYTPEEQRNYSKWCVTDFYDFDVDNPCYVEFHTNEPVVPKAYILTTGNDNENEGAEGRNPKDWTIQAKLNEDDEWVTIAVVTADQTMQDENFTDYTFAFSNAANNAYQYFRFEIYSTQGYFDECGDYHNDDTMQLSELRMWVKTQETLTAKTADNVEDYWTTYYNGTTGYKIMDSENACAYTATYSVSGDKGIITMHKLGKVIPAGTAVIIVGEDSEISMTTSTTAAENTVSNNLHGIDEATATATVKTNLGADVLLMLSNKNSHFGFHDYAGTNVPAGKAFLALSGDAAKVRTFSMVFEGETSGISLTPNPSPKGEGSSYYTLDGRRLSGKPTTKGVYVRNGSKVIVR